jgi:hypothetical protein
MKAKNTVVMIDVFNVYALTNEEMINIRGGEGDPIIFGTVPPVVI